MARTATNEAIIGRSGVSTTNGNSTPGDSANGNYVLAPLDGVILYVYNSGGVGVNITFFFAPKWEGQQIPSDASPGRVVTVPAGKFYFFGGFSESLYVQSDLTTWGIPAPALCMLPASNVLYLRSLRLPSAVSGA